jgi:phage shock protein A
MRPDQVSPFRTDTDAAALVDRLQKLRNLLPAFAQEAAAARREAARLRQQNTTLQTRLAELESRATARPTAPPTDAPPRRQPTHPER